MVNRMDDSTAQASVPVTMPGSRLKVLVYFLLAITVALTASTGFLLYERVSRNFTGISYTKSSTLSTVHVANKVTWDCIEVIAMKFLLFYFYVLICFVF